MREVEGDERGRGREKVREERTGVLIFIIYYIFFDAASNVTYDSNVVINNAGFYFFFIFNKYNLTFLCRKWNFS
jgi:hypothetical protein